MLHGSCVSGASVVRCELPSTNGPTYSATMEKLRVVCHAVVLSSTGVAIAGTRGQGSTRTRDGQWC